MREGLLRVDYKGGHKNPETLTDLVPEHVKPYVGYFFQNEPHMHIYVEGCKDLAWAIPINADNFPVTQVENSIDFAAAVFAFASKINVVTPITIQNSLLL